MQVPLEIAFHNAESEKWAEELIRDRVADLEDLYGRLTSCRVRVDQRAKDSSGTIPPVVRIELGIPGHKEIVVSHEPEHLERKFQHPDLRKAIHEAFRIAERRLRDLKEQRERRAGPVGNNDEPVLAPIGAPHPFPIGERNIHTPRTAMMNSRGKRSSTLPSKRG